MIKTTARFYPSMTITQAELIDRLTFPEEHLDMSLNGKLTKQRLAERT